MSKILIVSDTTELSNNIQTILFDVGYEAKIAVNGDEAFEITGEFLPDIAIVDASCSGLNINTICKKLKLQGQTNDIQIILLTSKDTSQEEIMVGADGYITKPFNNNILIATVNAHLRIKKLLDILYTNNSELAKSLYQLNVLYNTSSQLAGTLDKSKLINIMNEGLEKSLNYSLCSTLVINDAQSATLIINSMHPITERLEHALKLRAMIGYKNMFDDANPPFDILIDNISVEKYSKHPSREFDLDVLHFDNLFSPISTSDKFFGTVEVMRENELSGEDSTCFQTVVKQVSLPLESAILYEEIKETNIKLEKLEKLKSEFISIVSHELRTPLTAIKNSLDIMLSGKTGEITKIMDNFLNMAKRNVQRLSGIINDLLDLSKIEAGKMEYRFETVNVTEPLEFVKSTFEHLAQKKHIELVLEADSEIPKVYCDIQRIEQVLSNLVSNAIKFTPENGKIEMRAEIINAENLDCSRFFVDPSLLNSKPKKLFSEKYIQISVKDNGIGIKEEDIPKVFDKFQQIESSLSREVGGTGLGLPIAKQLIDAHRGEIWLESEPGSGAKFSFILPVLEQKSKFLLELDKKLQHTKYNHSSLTLVLIQEENCNGSIQGLSLIDALSNKNEAISEGIDASQIFLQSDCSVKKAYITFMEKDNTAVELIIKRFEDYIKDCHSKGEFFDTLIGTSVYPDGAINADELLEHAGKSLRQVCAVG